FFQAEDGIRDFHVTGVQTCALPISAEEAMEHGLLGGWNVRKEPLLADVAGELIPVPEKYAVVRDNPVERGRIDVLGTVGESYTVIQNEEHAGLLNALVD